MRPEWATNWQWCPTGRTCSELCRWLGQQAEELGVDILTGCAASQTRFDGNGSVIGVTLRDMGVAKDGSQKPCFQAGANITARATLFAEGCRGSLTEVCLLLLLLP